MRYLALATDYDGTLAEHGSVSEETLQALRRLRESGRRLLLVTGRELDDLRQVFPHFEIFDRIVAENGALLFCPETREERALAEPPPRALIERLAALGVQPLSVGRVIVATWSPHEQAVLDAIHALGLELQVIFNKGAVMILPSGVNKAFGLRAALAELALSLHNTVAIGDAENDHALLAACELGAAVDNALPMLKERADWTTAGARGAGVRELIDELLASDLRTLEPRLARHDVPLGMRGDSALGLHPYGRRVLLCGASGSGKSTFATAFLEALVERAYQFCLVDPEGDFGGLPFALALGDAENAVSVDEVATVLRSADKSVIASLLAITLDARGAFLLQLFARCAELRALSGRPHWFVIDEAHHMLPATDIDLPDPITHAPSGLLLITVHPEKLAARVLRQIDTVIVVGPEPQASIAAFATAVGLPQPAIDAAPAAGEALFWAPREQNAPVVFTPAKPKSERRRHDRKYAAGALGEDKSFYFRGPDAKLNLRAHNLMLFLQIGDGVDDATWLHHLRNHDYSGWVKTAIKNDELAESLEAIESDQSLDAAATRKRMREAIEKVYTLPA